MTTNFSEASLKLYYDRSEAERVLFTNIVEDFVGEPARTNRPDPTVTLFKRQYLKTV